VGLAVRGWTPKGAIARSRRNLAGAAERVRAVAIEWSDVDRSFEDEAEELAKVLDDFASRIERETLSRLEAGEHVGI
jgi:hypothetical protein